jgi:hypothetical protein
MGTIDVCCKQVVVKLLDLTEDVQPVQREEMEPNTRVIYPDHEVYQLNSNPRNQQHIREST